VGFGFAAACDGFVVADFVFVVVAVALEDFLAAGALFTVDAATSSSDGMRQLLTEFSEYLVGAILLLLLLLFRKPMFCVDDGQNASTPFIFGPTATIIHMKT